MLVDRLTKVPVHEFPIGIAERWNAIYNRPPNIEIIPLVYNPVIFADREFRTSIKRGGWESFKAHHHFPLKEDIVRIHDNGEDVHAKLFATFSQPVAHRNEFRFTLDPLNAIFENDIFMIIWENM